MFDCQRVIQWLPIVLHDPSVKAEGYMLAQTTMVLSDIYSGILSGIYCKGVGRRVMENCPAYGGGCSIGPPPILKIPSYGG